ncbi:MAG: signal peptidase I [Clostridiales bacterium]|nr:signal peptidase I [Clostridiales bacterium]
MNINEESTRLIKELEEELSDDRIAEIFRLDEDRAAHVSSRKGRLTGRTVVKRLIVLAVVFVCVVVTLQFFEPMVIIEPSMREAIMPKDCIVLATRAYSFGDIGYGDIVVHGSGIQDGSGGALSLCGRVIGLPGDEVEIRDGSVFRNGVRLYEPYVMEGVTDGNMALSVVPEGHCFLLGDARQSSVDSRDGRIGFVPVEEIMGKAVFRILPVSKAGRIE